MPEGIPENVDLQWIARRLVALQHDVLSLRDQVTVLTGFYMRQDGALTGLTTSTNAIWQLLNRIEQRTRALEQADASM